MKKHVILFSFILLSVLGCKLLDKLTQFNIEFDETIVIPSTTPANLPIDILTPDLETNSESVFANNDTRKDLIEEIRLTTLTLTISSPANADFSFLKSVSVFISAENLPEERIAWKDLVPDDAGATISLDLADLDLKEYIKKDKFKLRLSTQTDEILTSDHQIEVHSVFFVDAKILGI